MKLAIRVQTSEGMKIKWIFLVLAIALLSASRSDALIIAGTDPPTLTGCPDGSATLAHLKSFVRWVEGPPFGGGEWHIYYRENTDAFIEALTNFAAVRASILDLVIRDRTKQSLKVNGITMNVQDDSCADWKFILWNPDNWNRLYNVTNAPFYKGHLKPVPAPRLEVYLGGNVDWLKFKLPQNLRVNDERVATRQKDRQ